MKLFKTMTENLSSKSQSTQLIKLLNFEVQLVSKLAQSGAVMGTNSHDALESLTLLELCYDSKPVKK